MMNTEGSAIPCRFCRQDIDPLAKKCPHCGELLVEHSALQVFSRKAVGIAGIGTALLSLFFGLKEGYFYIAEQQQQRDMLSSHVHAAQQFMDIGNLEYAESSLRKALEISPNDKDIRLQQFFLETRVVLFDTVITRRFPADNDVKAIPELVVNGYSLMDYKYSPADQSRLKTYLARLLRHDSKWNKRESIEELFISAITLDDTSDEAHLWYGMWLKEQNRLEQSLFHLEQAVALNPEASVHLYRLAQTQHAAMQYDKAFESFTKLLKLSPEGRDLQELQALNVGADGFFRLIKDAANEKDILDSEFYGLSMIQRLAVFDVVLNKKSYPGDIYFDAARLYFHNKRYESAEDVMLRRFKRSLSRAALPDLKLLADIYHLQGKSEKESEIQELLKQKEGFATLD